MNRLRKWWHCPHSSVRGIYADEIIHCGYYRLQCNDCGRFLNGPVRIAELRKNESAAARGDVAE